MGLDGSISNTPILWPLLLYSSIREPIRVLFPAPGDPVMPIVWALPALGKSSFKYSIPRGVKYSI